MSSTKTAMVVGSFIADSFSLGVHWIYNVNVIDRKIGRLDQLLKPTLAAYHKDKEAGEFTHYGDQMLVLLESVADADGFNLEHFSSQWQTLFKDYDGYVDQATKVTLSNLDSQTKVEAAGSESTDLAGASRIAPIVYAYSHEPQRLIDASRNQTMMTHKAPEVIEAAAYFARVTADVLTGTSPVDALQKAIQQPDSEKLLAKWVGAGINSQNQDTREAIKGFGQMCEIDAAFPATIHLIAKYEQDYKLALVENAMAGGDSAARGMLAGMVLGAYLGLDAIPADWRNQLRAHQPILELLDRIDKRSID
jgi:ADP-ribosylglycohydrolase